MREGQLLAWEVGGAGAFLSPNLIAVTSGSPTGISHCPLNPLLSAPWVLTSTLINLGCSSKYPERKRQVGNHPDMMMTSHQSPRSSACVSAPIPGGFISFICRCNICEAAAWKACEIFRGHVSGAGEECL